MFDVLLLFMDVFLLVLLEIFLTLIQRTIPLSLSHPTVMAFWFMHGVQEEGEGPPTVALTLVVSEVVAAM